MKGLLLCWDSFEKRFSEYRGKIAHVLRADSRKVTLVDTIKDVFMVRWEPRRLNINDWGCRMRVRNMSRSTNPAYIALTSTIEVGRNYYLLCKLTRVEHQITTELLSSAQPQKS